MSDAARKSSKGSKAVLSQNSLDSKEVTGGFDENSLYRAQEQESQSCRLKAEGDMYTTFQEVFCEGKDS